MGTCFVASVKCADQPSDTKKYANFSYFPLDLLKEIAVSFTKRQVN